MDSDYVRESKRELRQQAVNGWATWFAVSRRTATRWYDRGYRPIPLPHDPGPLLRPRDAASILGTSTVALKRFLQRSRPKLGSLDLRPTRIVLQRRADRRIIRPAKPLVRVSVFRLGLFIRHCPKRMSKCIRGWLELVVDELPDLPDGPRMAAPETWRPLPGPACQFLLAPAADQSLGRWLAGLVPAWKSHDVSFAGVHLSIRLNEALLLRLELPARQERNASVRLFGPGNKRARQMTITFEDGSECNLPLDAGLPAEAGVRDHDGKRNRGNAELDIRSQ